MLSSIVVLSISSQMSTPAIISATPGILPTPGQLSALDMLPSRRTMPTPGADSVFQTEDFDDVFYDEPTPTSAMVWSRFTNSASSLRHRCMSEPVEVQVDNEDVVLRQNATRLHPLSALFYDSSAPISAEIR